jgi:uncharacterized membrane protein YhaH (DUF805 family)
MSISRNHLKEASFLVLLFTAFSFIRMIIQLFVGFEADPTQVGVSHEIIVATMIVMFVVGLILLLPQLYVGVKGMKIAKNPTSSKGHIVWAVILLVFTAFGVISTVSSIAEQINVIDNVITLVDHALDVIVYCMYIKYANRVLKGI